MLYFVPPVLLYKIFIVLFFTRGDNIVAVATMGSDPVAAQAAEMFHNQIPFLKQDIM
jgi:hypothetical protein